MAEAGKKFKEDIFSLTEQEIELLLEIVRSHAASFQFEGKEWESVKSS